MADGGSLQSPYQALLRFKLTPAADAGGGKPFVKQTKSRDQPIGRQTHAVLICRIVSNLELSLLTAWLIPLSLIAARVKSCAGQTGPNTVIEMDGALTGVG
jgi:hypothetical protein